MRPHRIRANRIASRLEIAIRRTAELREMRAQLDRVRASYRVRALQRRRAWIERIHRGMRGRVRGDQVKCIACNRWFKRPHPLRCH